MLQTTGALKVNNPPIKSISAVKRYDRSKTPKQRNARVGWKRIKDNIDDLVAKTGANPELASVISRWCYFGHITHGEAMAARLYGETVGAYERFFMEGVKRNAQSPSYQRGTAGAQDVIALHINRGTISDYERAAKKAKNRYKKLQQILAPFPGASDILNDVCLHDTEVATEFRPHVKILLRKVGEGFGIIGGKRT